MTEFSIKEHPDYGVELSFESEDVLDKFDDYLTEETYTLFELREGTAGRSILFGQASCQEKVRDIVIRFLAGS